MFRLEGDPARVWSSAIPTTFYLIRHATHDLVGRTLAGRMDGVALSEQGRLESGRLADRLGGRAIAAIYSSPLQRAQETARPLARRTGLTVDIEPALNEFDFGAWTGREFASLEGDPLWKLFNTWRSGTRAPGGESMLEVQARIVGILEALHVRHTEDAVALVSHGDVLKAAVLHYLGMALDSFMRIELEPASVTVLELAHWGARIVTLNDTRAKFEPS